MKPYLAIGIRTDIAGDKRAYADGNSPKEARHNLMQKHMHLSKVFTIYVAVADRRMWQKKMEES